MKRFIKLMDKDWRLYRGPVIGLLVFMMLPYIVTRSIDIYMALHLEDRTIAVHDERNRVHHENVTVYTGPHQWAMVNVFLAIGMGAFTALLVAPAFGGCVFAIERRDRSAEFLAMLPIRRTAIIGSKLLLAICLLALAAGIQYLIGVILFPGVRIWVGETPYTHVNEIALYGSWALQFSTALAMFGIAWLLSSILRSPTISAVIAIAAAMLAIMLAVIWSVNPKIYTQLVYVNCGVGALCLVVANIYYARRIAP